MNGKLVYNKEFNRDIFIYLPPSYNCGKKYPVIYVHDGDSFADILEELMSFAEELESENYSEHIIVGITPIDRLDEYTPWSAAPLVEKFKAFGGKGEEYLSFIVNELKPYIDRTYNTCENNAGIMGFSLGGLISLFAMYKHACFDKVVSICGSQWYEGWIDFIKSNEIINKDINILLISGLKEADGKKTIQKNAVTSVEKGYEIFKSNVNDESNVSLEWDEYGHHNNRMERYKKAILYFYTGNYRI